jgi:peptidoglycan/LPS O-acetylase OafA/YrhL
MTLTQDQATPARADDPAAATSVIDGTSGRPRHDLPVLEAFRGLAAVMVVFTHVGFVSGTGVAGAWAGWLSRLDFGVALFFLLSGFLLFRPFVQAAYGRRPRVAVRGYLRRRYLRIYPAFVAVLAFDYLITPAARDADGALWLQTLSMTQNYSTYFLNQLPGLVQAWSLAVEVSFYLALPLLARLVLGEGTVAARTSARARAGREQRRARTPAQLRAEALEFRRRPPLARLLTPRPWQAELPALRPGLVLGALMLISIGWRLYFMLDPGGLDNQLLWLPAFLDWFGAGMLLAWLRERDAGVPALLRDVASAPGACWSLALAGFWLGTTQLAGPYGLTGPNPGEAMFKHLLFLAVATLVLVPAVFGDSSARWRRTAGNRFFGRLGQISFGLFLWHPMLMAAIRRMLRLEPMTGGFWLTLTLTLIAGSIAGTLSWRYLEEPLQRRYRNGFRGGPRESAAGERRRFVIRRRATTAPRAAAAPGHEPG